MHAGVMTTAWNTTNGENTFNNSDVWQSGTNVIVYITRCTHAEENS